MILSLFRKDPAKEAAEALYAAAVEQSRRPEFYAALGVDDSVEGRFELLALHVYLLLRRLKTTAGGPNAPGPSRLSQRLLDAMFDNLDAALREMGVGDLSVGRKIRGMAESFFGRAGAYEAAIAAADEGALSAAIARNVFGAAASASSDDLSRYVFIAVKTLNEQPTGRLEAGVAQFPSPMSFEVAADGAQ